MLCEKFRCSSARSCHLYGRAQSALPVTATRYTTRTLVVSLLPSSSSFFSSSSSSLLGGFQCVSEIAHKRQREESRGAGGGGGGGSFLRATRVCRRPQAIKPNPNQTADGRFDRSFEKITTQLEDKMVFRQKNMLQGNLYDHNFGEEGYDDLRKAAKDDMEGREPEKPAARMARSYFSGEDLSPEALHVRSPRLKVAQNKDRLNYDKTILKTSTEASEYYYPEQTLGQKRTRMWMSIGACALVAGVGVVGTRRLFVAVE